MTENANPSERHFHVFHPSNEALCEESIVINEEREEMIEKRAISFIENMADLGRLGSGKNSNDEGYKFEEINEQIVASLKEKELDYDNFFGKIENSQQ